MNWKLRRFIQMFIMVGVSVGISSPIVLALLVDWKLGLLMFPAIGLVLLVGWVLMLFGK
jgi:hypothetical protein